MRFIFVKTPEFIETMKELKLMWKLFKKTWWQTILSAAAFYIFVVAFIIIFG